MRKRGFTLLELVIVIVIIGILATLGLVNFGSVKEKYLDKEAIVNLKLIQVAEKIYKLEYKDYYPPDPPSITDIGKINTYLRLSLPKENTRNWNYTVDKDGGGVATRNGADARTWSLLVDETVEPHSP